MKRIIYCQLIFKQYFLYAELCEGDVPITGSLVKKQNVFSVL